MRITITGITGDVLRTFKASAADLSGYDAFGIDRCPECRSTNTGVYGRNERVDSHGSTADACCVRCLEQIGTIRVDLDTIFGREEDHAVLCGRPRVYG